jgi:hypothetical protein
MVFTVIDNWPLDTKEVVIVTVDERPQRWQLDPRQASSRPRTA